MVKRTLLDERDSSMGLVRGARATTRSMFVLLTLSLVIVACAGKKRSFGEAVPGGDDTEDSLASESDASGAVPVTPEMRGVDDEAQELAPLGQEAPPGVGEVLPGDAVGGQAGASCDNDAGSCTPIDDPGSASACVPTGPRDCTSDLDNDCDGQPDNVLDDVCVCLPESVEPCEEHPGLDGRGQCRAGTRTCIPGEGNISSNWGTCEGSVGPGERDSCSVTGDDTDCDGINNGGCPCIEGETRPCGPDTENGICQRGTQTCVSGTFGQCAGAVFPAPRSCASNQDNDCDGRPDNAVDNVCTCMVGSVQACGTHPGRDGNGQCEAGSQRCEGRGNNATSTFGTCTGSVGPALQDTCAEGNDENCNGIPNEGCACVNGQTRSCGPDTEVGPCQRGTQACVNGSFGACQGAVFPAPRNCASAQDNDCDGRPDDTLDNVCTCQGGLTACGNLSNTCFDLDTDPNNCGECGRGCFADLGGTCTGGSCNPAQIATGETLPGTVLLSDTHVYWITGTGSRIRRVPRDGGAVETVFTGDTATSGTENLLIANNQLYFSNLAFAGAFTDRVMRSNLDGSNAQAFSQTYTGNPVIDSVVASNGFIFHAVYNGDSTTNFVRQTNTGAQTDFGLINDRIRAMTAAAGCIFYTTQAVPNQIIRKCAAGETITHYNGAGAVLFQRIGSNDGNNLFFTDNGGLSRIGLSAGSTVVRLTTVTPGAPVIDPFDNTALYYFARTGALGQPACTREHTLFRAGKEIATAGPVVILPPPHACPTGVAVAADALFWSNSETGTIMKLAK